MKTKEKRVRLLITGVSGVLGNNLARYFCDRYDVLGLYGSHAVSIDGIALRRVDLLSPESVETVIKEFEPRVIIHCAAKANVDECEEHPEVARKVNVDGTKLIVDSMNGRETKLVYISTDSVYDGRKGNYVETDPVHPLSVYARSKHNGEGEVLKRKNSLVVRTAFFGWDIQNRRVGLAEWIMDQLSQKQEIRGFEDVFTSLIYTFKLAELLEKAIQKDLKGIYHIVSRTSMSKYEFALKLADFFGFDKSLIKAASVKNSGLKADRPLNLRLNTDKLTQDLNVSLPTIEESLAQFYQDFESGLPQKIRTARHSQRSPKGEVKNLIKEEILRSAMGLPQDDSKDISQQSQSYPQLNFIPYGRQDIEEEDIQAVVEVLKSRYLTQGPKVAEFESVLCHRTDAHFAVAVNSGTSGLHIACLAAGIELGDEVITTPNTFVASANCVVFCGGKPIFADIDAETYNISPREIEKKMTAKTKAVIPVHFAGQSCDMQHIRNIVQAAEKKYGHKIFIIEDASHALGSRYKDYSIGACPFSDMAIMSFHPVKHITTAEGGAVLTNDAGLFKKLKFFRSHGISNSPEDIVYKDQAFVNRGEKETPVLNPWYYEQISLGYNYRITDLQCALGISQLKRFDVFRRCRREIVNRYNSTFKNIPNIKIPFESKDCDSNFHLYVALFDFANMGLTRAEFMFRLRNQGIQTQVHYIPVHTQPFYQNQFKTRWGDCPQAESYYQKCLSLPLFSAMTDEDVDQVIREVKSLQELKT